MATQPTLAMIPSGYKDGKLYSVLPSDGVGDFDVTRGSNATRINKNGLIETVSGNTPRLNYPLIDGVVSGCPSLLLEPQSTNLVPYSEDLTTLTKTNTTITANQAISPDGTLNADEIIGTGFARSVYAIGSGNITVSCYVKSNDGSNKDFTMGAGSLGASGNSTFTATGEWQRFTHTFSTTAQSTDFGFFASGGTSLGLYLFGWQLEQGSFPTSYIKSNSGSTTTRLSDTANNAGNASTFNDSEGVLMSELSIDANDGNFRFLSLSDGTSTNSVWIYYRSDVNQINFRVIVGGVSSFDKIYTINDATSNNKLLLKYKENDFSAWVNGFEVLTTNSGITFPNGVLNKIEFNRPDGINNFYGKTKQIQYYNTVLTDLELEKITSYTSFNAMALAQNYTI